MADTSELVALLGLEPHVEGGWFRETWKAPGRVVPEGYGGTEGIRHRDLLPAAPR